MLFANEILNSCWLYLLLGSSQITEPLCTTRQSRKQKKKLLHQNLTTNKNTTYHPQNLLANPLIENTANWTVYAILLGLAFHWRSQCAGWCLYSFSEYKPQIFWLTNSVRVYLGKFTGCTRASDQLVETFGSSGWCLWQSIRGEF